MLGNRPEIRDSNVSSDLELSDAHVATYFCHNDVMTAQSLMVCVIHIHEAYFISIPVQLFRFKCSSTFL